LKEGDKVTAFVHGGKYQDIGSFAEYAKVRGDFVVTLPENAEEKGWGKQGGLEAGSSLGVPFSTAAMVSSMGLAPIEIMQMGLRCSASSMTKETSTLPPRSPTENGYVTPTPI
jgi:NADPH:quinone reductase-like Zn-dependent oxidoreductase